MTSEEKAKSASKPLSKPARKTNKSLAARVLHQRSASIKAKSSVVIKRNVTTHRDALERLANR